jgi:hypothetical protein
VARALCLRKPGSASLACYPRSALLYGLVGAPCESVGLRVQHCENKDTYECWHGYAKQQNILDAEQRGFEIVTESTKCGHGLLASVERWSGRCWGVGLRVLRGNYCKLSQFCG